MPADRGLIDTSVVIALGSIEANLLPRLVVVSALSLAELAAGPALVSDEAARALRAERVQRAETAFEALAFDSRCARAYGRVVAAIVVIGRKPRGPQIIDLMIAATALANDLPLYSLNAADLKGLAELIEIVDLGAGDP